MNNAIFNIDAMYLWRLLLLLLFVRSRKADSDRPCELSIKAVYVGHPHPT